MFGNPDTGPFTRMVLGRLDVDVLVSVADEGAPGLDAAAVGLSHRARARCSTRTSACIRCHPARQSAISCGRGWAHNVPFVALDERLVVVARESGATSPGWLRCHGLKRR